jgi:predicted permease
MRKDAMRLRDFMLRVRALVRPRRVERELHDELASHLDHEARKLERAGMPAREARTEALRRFGSATRCRDERHVTAVTDMLADLRFAGRQFRRRPLSSLTMIVVLALGIGFSSSLFILFSSIESSPPAAVDRDERRVRVRGIDRGRGPGRAIGREFPYAEYREYAAVSQVFESVAAWTSTDVVLDVGQGTARLVSGAATYVTGAYFPVLGIQVIVGAGLPTDAADNGAPVLAAVISHAIWERYFDKASDVIGRTMKVNGTTVTITGVAPRRFAGARSGGSVVRVWLPLNARRIADRATLTRGSEDAAVFGLVARLQPDVDHARATTAAAAVALRYRQSVDAGASTRLTTDVVPLLSENYFPPSGEPSGGAGRFVALAMPLLVLLITCTNVSALLAGIALSRRREMAIRLALGAHRRRIVRLLLTETSLLALCAGALGLGAVAIIIRVFDATVLGAPLMIDWGAGVFTAMLALATGVIFGLSPALHATRLAVSDVLKDSDVVSRRSRLQAGLVVAQIALTQPALLSMGALLLELREDLSRSSTSRLGDQVLDVRFNTNPRYGAIDARREAAILRVQQRLERLPGVQAVVPQDAIGDSARVSSHEADRVPGVSGADDESVSIHSAPSGYFAALGREVERGREFGPAERSSDGLVVIDRALARRLWGDAAPIGRRLIADDPGYPRNAGVFTVIGVADDRGARGLFLPDVSVTSHLLIRTDGPAETLAQAIRAAALAEAPELPIVSARSLAAVEAAAQLPAIQGIASAGGSGLLALGLAAIGLYGVVAVTVAQRVREIGIRTALGADRRRIIRLFVARGLRLSLAGLTIGLALSVAAARAIAAAEGDTPPSGLLPLSIGVAAFVMAVALAASWMPARRAARVDSLTALRAD